MIRLDDNFYKYQALAAMAAAANYSSFMNTSLKRVDDEDDDEPVSKRFKQEYSDIDSEDDLDKKEEEIDVGEEEDQKVTPRKSSFFISDILGLNPPQPEPKNMVEQLIQNYQQQIQRTFDIYRLLSNQNQIEVKTSAIEERKEESGSASILSSLEKLAKSQLNEAQNPAEIINSPKMKKCDRKPVEIKKLDETPKETETAAEPKVDPKNQNLFPAWVYCTRYSDRPSAGPRHRKKKAKQQQQQQPQQQQPTAKPAKKDVLKNIQSYQSSSSSNSSFSLESPNVSKSKENEIFIDSDDELANDYDDNDSNASHSKRPRTAFTSSQLQRLKNEFEKCKYLTGEKRQYLANELNLNESQIKIWFQNKRAKIKKSSGVKNGLALQLMAQGLYNHSNNNKTNQSNDS